MGMQSGEIIVTRMGGKMKYYIADAHFGHVNVIKFDKRPFNSVDEMDKYMIEAWNSRVQKWDDVYIIGDFAVRNEKTVKYYASRLNGHKHLVLGNHDKLSDEDKECFVTIEKMMHITDYVGEQKYEICLCHYPIAEYNGYYKGHYHIYGHIHGNRNDTYEFMSQFRPKALNAGCMINNYMPVTLGELIGNNEYFKMDIYAK